MSDRSGQVGQSVLLRHTLADGSRHLDWMIERRWAPELLITFRLAIGTDLMASGGFEAERIGDHRRAYLDYEGPISGGRGEVTCEGKFEVLELDDQPEFLRVILKAPTGAYRTVEWTGQRVRTGLWRFAGRGMLE